MSYTDAKKVVYLQSIYKELESLVKEIGTVEGTSTTWNSIIGDQTSVNLSGFTNDAGFITSESDPTFATSPAASITQTDIDLWDASLQSGDNISFLTNDAGYISDTSNFVTINGSQTITGQKTFRDGANIRVSSSDSNVGGFQMLKEDDALLNLGFEDDYLRWRRGGTGAFAGWRWDSYESTSLTLTTAGDATFSGDVIVSSTIADITAGPANILTTKEWVEANVVGEESDPVFTASPAGGITAGDITNWNSAIQPGDNVSTLNNDAGYITATTGFSGSFATATDTITVENGLITAVTPL